MSSPPASPPPWLLLLALALAGALGALLRVAVTMAVAHLQARVARRGPARPFPLGTLIVNASGAFAAGVLAGFLPGLAAGGGASVWGWVLGVGLLGAFTTFSTWMVEVRLRPGLPGLYYLGATLVLGVGAALAGVALGSR